MLLLFAFHQSKPFLEGERERKIVRGGGVSGDLIRDAFRCCPVTLSFCGAWNRSRGVITMAFFARKYDFVFNRQTTTTIITTTQDM